MLYDRWLDIARTRSAETALWDVASDREWSFRDLAAEADRLPAPSPGLVHPSGITVEFILSVLLAWRTGAICCPIETGQAPMELGRWPDGAAHLKLTSATAGTPRIVAFTARQLAADAKNIVETMGLRPEWPNFGVVSLAHSYGFSSLVTPLLLHGIPLVLVNSPLPEAVRRAAGVVPDITAPAVPALWRAWHDAAVIPPNVRLAISAGAPLPLALERELFQKLGLKIHNFYGATECGGIAYDRQITPRDDTACVGTPMNNVTLTAGTDGCLEVRGDAVGQTYWPEAHASLADGCYRTSDLVELKNGRIFLRGRAGDQINVAGRKVSPEAIERVLLAHESVRDCLVFGTPGLDHERGDIIVACVVARAPSPGDALKQFLLEKLPAWQVPREWRFVESLAPNARGKLSRAEWRVRLGYASPPDGKPNTLPHAQ
jgi:acyl-coenzyme A synthetase/AMP-(fatty) acid ligase